MPDFKNDTLVYQELCEFFKGWDIRSIAKGFMANILSIAIPNKNWENEFPKFNKKKREKLQEILAKHSFYQTYQSPSIRIGSRSSTLHPEYLAHYLERDVRKYGVEKSLEDLKHLLGSKTHELLLVAIIAGVTTENIIKINDDVSIVPLAEVQRAGILNQFFEGLENNDLNRRSTLSYSATMPDRHKFLSQQRCAIIYKYGEVPLYGEEEYRKNKSAMLLNICAKVHELESMVHSLTTIQKCAPMIEIRGQVSSDEVLNRFAMEGGGLETPKFTPYDIPNSEPLDEEKTKSLMNAYLNLTEGTLKDKIQLALQLIVHAQLVNGIEEKVIGYAMAWECLFQNSSAGLKKEKLSQRAAYILYPENSEEYSATKSSLESFYSLRGDIVHQGKINDEKKYGNLYADQLINKVTPYFHEAIRLIINKGGMPDWAKINWE